MQTADEILATVDATCDSCAFPMLDNGYFYLAATRLSLFRSLTDWALVIEVFGFSPREGLPSLVVSSVASTLHDRDPASRYVSDDACRNYLRDHPHDEFRAFAPIEPGRWIDGELVSEEAGGLVLRGGAVALPSRDEYARVDLELRDPQRVHVFELCRYLAAVRRDQVLATPREQRVSVLPAMQQLLQVDAWHHPDLVAGERPSELESFQQLAAVLSTGDVSLYRPNVLPNTHWRNWPESGSL